MEQKRVEPVELEVRECSEGYELALEGQPLLTTIGGHPVRHEAAALLEHMIEEYVKYPDITLVDGRITQPQFIGAYMLLGLQREFIDARVDNLTQNFAFELLRDPVLTRLAGPEQRDLAARYVAVQEWLTSEGLRLVDVDLVDLESIDTPDGYIRTNSTFGHEDTEAFHRLVDELRRMFDALTPEERAGVVFLHNAHEGSLVHGMALRSAAALAVIVKTQPRAEPQHRDWTLATVCPVGDHTLGRDGMAVFEQARRAIRRMAAGPAGPAVDRVALAEDLASP